MNVSLDKKNVRTTGKVYIKGILCGKITIAKLLVTLKKRWEREEKDTIVSKFNNNNFSYLISSFLRVTFVSVWWKQFQIYISQLRSKKKFLWYLLFVIPQIWYDRGVSTKIFISIEKTRVFLNVVKIVEQNISRYCILNAAYDFEILMRNW